MIFHHQTSTLIFTPTKAGSASLHKIAERTDGLSIITGPAAWNRKQMTPHVSAKDVDQVDDTIILRRVLLFRNPMQRLASLAKHLLTRGEITSVEDWVRHDMDISGGWQAMLDYCPTYHDIIRTEMMALDVARLFGVAVRAIHINQSNGQSVKFTPEQRVTLRAVYHEDFALHEKLIAKPRQHFASVQKVPMTIQSRLVRETRHPNTQGHRRV